MTDISGQESLAVLPEEKAPTRNPSKPQIRPAIYHPQKRTSIRSPKAATSRISADGYRRTSGNTNGGQPNNPKYTAVSSFRSSSTLRDAWAISATQNRKPRIFGRGCPRTGTLPLAENRGTAGQRTGRSAPGEIYDAVRLPAINRKQGSVQMNRPLPQQYATAAYFRCGFRLRHSSTGGMIPIEITSSRSLQRCP